MTVKEFCDVCDKVVVRNYVSNRPTRKYSVSSPSRETVNILIEIVSGVGNAWNAGTLCKKCLWRVVRDLLGSNTP